MKYFFLLSLSFISVIQLSGQKRNIPFGLTGKIEGLDSGYMYLYYQIDSTGALAIDSFPVKNHQFSFQGMLHEPTLVTLSTFNIKDKFYDENNITKLYIEPGSRINFSGKYSSLNEVKFTGYNIREYKEKKPAEASKHDLDNALKKQVNTIANDTSIGYFYPTVQISSKARKKYVYDTLLSNIVLASLTSLLDEKDVNPLTGNEILSNSNIENERISEFIPYLDTSIYTKKVKKEIIAPAMTMIDSLARLSHKKYAVCINLRGTVDNYPPIHPKIRTGVKVLIITADVVLIAAFAALLYCAARSGTFPGNLPSSSSNTILLSYENHFIIKTFLIDIEKRKVVAWSKTQSLPNTNFLNRDDLKKQLKIALYGIMAKKAKLINH